MKGTTPADGMIFGFVLGILCIWGSGAGSSSGIKKSKKCKDHEWDEIGENFEKKLKIKLKKWCEAEDDADWEEIGKKAGKKLKKKIKEWLDEK